MGQDKNTMLTFLIFGILAIGLHIANGETPIRYTILQNGPHCNKPGAAVKNPECSWHYLAYTPRIFRGGVTEKVLFMTHNVNFDVVIEAKLVKAKGSNEIASSGKVIAKPGQLTELLLKVPVDAPSKGIVKIDGSATVPYGTNGLTNPAKWFFNNQTKEIEIKKTSTSVFIQSDRPIYKPGETIQMRIVAVDSNLKAVKGKVSKVSVLNPSQTLMRQWSDVKLKGGIASLKLKLTIKPVLGVWRIKAVVNGIYKTIQVKVEKYVLPKFQVQIKPPPFIALGSLKADGEICAKYSYGKNVNGLLKAKICARHPAHWNRGWQKERAICEDIKRSIFGCTPFEIDLRYFKVYEYTGWSSIKFTIQASVEEKATGIALNATKKELKVHKSPVKLSFEGTPDIFKPGLPFNAEVRATSPDGSPADNIKVNVVVRGGYRKTLFSGDVTVRNGRGKIDVKEIPFDVKEVSFDATYRRPKISGSKVSDYKRRSSAYHNAKAWYSPSHSYLGIIKPRTILKVGSAARIKVRYTTVDQNPTNRTVYYSLMCKGYATHSGSIVTEFIGANSRIKRSVEDVPPTTAEIPRTTAEQTNPEPTKPDRTEPEPTLPDSPEEPTLVTVIPTTTPEPTTTASEIEDTYVPWWRRKTATRPPLPERFSSGSFDIKFRVTQEMSPSCRMLVYYVRNAENVADSVVIDVEDSFANEVSMKFAKGEVFPGTKVKLSLKASPGSRFAISAVDKSVHFLANANDIKTNQVSGILKSLDIGPGHISEGERCGGERRWYWGYHSQSDFVDSQKAFNDGGLLFLSNTQIDTRPCKREYYDYYYREDLYATAMPRIFTTVAALPATEAYYIATTSPDTRGWWYGIFIKSGNR